MKKLLFAIFLTFLYSVSAYGQVPTNIPNTVIQVFPGAPTGACLSVMVATRQDTGAFYDCFGGVWTPVGGAGAGANSSLSNLSNPTAVNQSLIPATTGLNLGTLANPWANIFIQSLTFPGLQVGFFCFPGTLPTPPTGYGGLGCIDANGKLNQYDIATSAWNPILDTSNFPGTTTATAIGGVSYSALYPGTSLDQRVNASIVDAETGANGAISHISSSVGEPASLTTNVNGILSGLLIGDVAQDPVTWIPPASCQWDVYMTTGNALTQYGNSRIDGMGQERSGCVIENKSAANAVGYMYITGSGEAYYSMSGLDFFVRDNTATLASNTVFRIIGAYDNSDWHDFGVANYPAGTIGIQVGYNGPCCSANMNNFYVYGNNTGSVELDITASNGPQGMGFSNVSLGHSAIGTNVFSCIDTSTSPKNQLSFTTLYMEETNSSGVGNTASPGFDNGCLITIHGEKNVNLGSTAETVQAWTIASSTHPASFHLDGLEMNQNWNKSIVSVVNNNYAGGLANVASTDPNGEMTEYNSNSSYFDTIVAAACTGCGGTANQTIQQAGTPLAQEPVINFVANMTCADNPGVATNCTPANTASTAFSALSGSTNTTAAMVVGAGASLNFASTGTINASTLAGSAIGTSGATIPLLSTANTFGTGQVISGTLGVGAITGTSFLVAANGSYLGWNGRSRMLSNADGDILVENSGASSFTRFSFGPDTTSFGAICPSGTTLQFMVAGACTTAAPITAASLNASSFLNVTPIAVASLPAAAGGNAGQMRVVNDSTTIALEGQTCVGSSSNTALAFSNGTVWKCF